MMYFNYNTSFKKTGALTDLVEKQGIERVYDLAALTQRLAKGEDAYAFVSPYSLQIDGEKVLDWAKTEDEAWDKFYRSCEQI